MFCIVLYYYDAFHILLSLSINLRSMEHACMYVDHGQYRSTILKLRKAIVFVLFYYAFEFFYVSETTSIDVHCTYFLSNMCCLLFITWSSTQIIL
jgi:hypothetical protein